VCSVCVCVCVGGCICACVCVCAGCVRAYMCACVCMCMLTCSHVKNLGCMYPELTYDVIFHHYRMVMLMNQAVVQHCHPTYIEQFQHLRCQIIVI